MQSLFVRFRRFTWALGAICGFIILLTLVLFMQGNPLLGMYVATFLVFLVPVMAGFLIFKQTLENISNQLNQSMGPVSNPPYQEQSNLSTSAD